MSGLLAWFVIGLASVAGYVGLALAGQPLWYGLPFLALIVAAEGYCLTYDRRASGSHD